LATASNVSRPLTAVLSIGAAGLARVRDWNELNKVAMFEWRRMLKKLVYAATIVSLASVAISLTTTQATQSSDTIA
jgi:hypothetical protein